MRKTKETHTFDFRPLGLAIREAREKAGLSRNDLGDKVFYGERHIADIENVGSHPSFQLFHDLEDVNVPSKNETIRYGRRSNAIPNNYNSHQMNSASIFSQQPSAISGRVLPWKRK